MGSDKQRGNLRSWLRGGLRYFGPTGYLVAVLPDYLRYYRRDFHPWQDDNRALIESAERELSRLLGAQ
jgi:predicted metal-dependent hydrolase